MLNVLNRDQIIIPTLEKELIGPCPFGTDLEVVNNGAIVENIYDDKSNYIEKNTGEEIIKIPPIQRYGVAVLYPKKLDTSTDMDGITNTPLIQNENNDVEVKFSNEISNEAYIENGGEIDTFNLDLVNSRLPSSIGFTCFFKNINEIDLTVTVSFSLYKQVVVKESNGKNKTNWWVRKPFKIIKKINHSDLLNKRIRIPLNVNDEDLKDIYIEGIARGYSDYFLSTLVLVNKKETENFIEYNEKSLFQSKMIISSNDQDVFLPYKQSSKNHDSDDLLNQLLYRNVQVYAKGHGNSCTWKFNKRNFVDSIETSALPVFESPSISAEVYLSKELKLEILMADLANFCLGSAGDKQLKLLLSGYEAWIQKKNYELDLIDDDNLRHQAIENIEICKKSLSRMKAGYDLLCSDSKIAFAFKLTNEAMLEQQKHAPKKIRKIKARENGNRCLFDSLYSDNKVLGVWRPFQIGFLLMNIASIVDQNSFDNKIVDLIWFPTGGGKTEAYLAVSAFTILLDRIWKRSEYSENGVLVLMRYTLRLLTAQQLQRASTLICTLEKIRIENKLGGSPFSIGLWVGGDNTPNKRDQALKNLKDLKNDISKNGNFKNNFLFDRCPYCSAQMGVIKINNEKFISGYEVSHDKKTVIFKCNDHSCLFHEKLPIYIIDEDIYEYRPTIVIGTVDKFAMLAWNPKVRSIFGINSSGDRICHAPKLIIQDELHLISGPLGSMVGLYEPLIQYLCEHGHSKGFKPKIICATATTKGYRNQVRDLFGRKDVSIFPPPGISVDDSFFAKYEYDENGDLTPGRKYVGVCAPGLGSMMTTQVRTHAALLFSSNLLDIEQRDPWITLLNFFNSIRELGGALTLYQSDILSYLKTIKQRYPENIVTRKYFDGIELTSRLQDDEIPKAMALLEKELDRSFFNEENTEILINELQKISKNLNNFSKLNNILDILKTDKSVKFKHYFDLYNIYIECKSLALKVPKVLENIIKTLNGSGVEAFCLASSIIEVGVDIDRLALMTIVGQPKTTAQYIQVSGRVGRRKDRPGLVVTLYNSFKARDKSVYEDFTAYHQRLYANVEPSVLTPFSRPAIKRGLRAILIGYIRQTMREDIKPSEVSVNQIKEWKNYLISSRGEFLNSTEKNNINAAFEDLIKRWEKIRMIYTKWGALNYDNKIEPTQLLYPLGLKGMDIRFPCPTSMRNVDGTSSIWITSILTEDNNQTDNSGWEW